LASPILVLNFVLMMVAAAVPLYVAYRIRGINRKLLKLALFVASFTLSHGLYHFSNYIGLAFFAKVLFEPLAALLLLAFGIYYWKAGV